MTRGGAQGREDGIIVHIDEDLEEIVPNFLKNRDKDMESISRALESGDFETIRIMGHGMKGSGSGYGFDRISRMGEEIEKRAKEKDAEEIKKIVREMAAYLDRVEIVYE